MTLEFVLEIVLCYCTFQPFAGQPIFIVIQLINPFIPFSGNQSKSLDVTVVSPLNIGNENFLAPIACDQLRIVKVRFVEPALKLD